MDKMFGPTGCRIFCLRHSPVEIRQKNIRKYKVGDVISIGSFPHDKFCEGCSQKEDSAPNMAQQFDKNCCLPTILRFCERKKFKNGICNKSRVSSVPFRCTSLMISKIQIALWSHCLMSQSLIFWRPHGPNAMFPCPATGIHRVTYLPKRQI